MGANILELFQSMDHTSRLAILTAAAIIVIILFAKAIKWILKLAVIAGMLLLIAFFLRQAGFF